MLKLTHSGLAFDMLDCKPSMVCIEDIAWHLAHINRWTGAAKRPMSVAEHSLLVVMIMERSGAALDPRALRAALLHDAHEYITNDVCTLGKRFAGDAWHAMARRVQHAIEQRFGICDAARTHHASIKHADLVAMATELRDLLPPFTNAALRAEFDAALAEVEPEAWIDLNEWDEMSPTDWAAAFIDKHDEITIMSAAVASATADQAA